MNDPSPVTDAPPKRYTAYFTVELLNAIAVKFSQDFELAEGRDPNAWAAGRCESFRDGFTHDRTWYPAHQIQHVTWTTEEITDAQTN